MDIYCSHVIIVEVHSYYSANILDIASSRPTESCCLFCTGCFELVQLNMRMYILWANINSFLRFYYFMFSIEIIRTNLGP